MEKPWATLGIDLHLQPAGGGVRRGLTVALRDAVRTGRLAPGTRLPSSRSLATDLGLARNTVAGAYADLVAEGWLTARQGSGTRVADRPVPPPARHPDPTPSRTGRPAYSLIPGSPDLASFPRTQWLKAARRALAAAPNDALGYGDPRGRAELRTALAGYLARARGVRTDPDRIVVSAGFAHALRLLSQVLHARGLRTLAVESYGLDVHWSLAERAGLRTRPLPFDASGTDPDGLAGERAVLLTPSHQFPMGVTLRPERRAAVVDWARRTGGLILEDDYDGEFRYDRQPVGALQGLDPERVAYTGSVSKSLAPGLRLGWLMVPEWLAEDVVRRKRTIDLGHPSVDQAVFARFLERGDYDRQLRRCQRAYRERRDALVAALAEHFPGAEVSGIAAGLHVIATLPERYGPQDRFLARVAGAGVAVRPLSDCRYRPGGDPGKAAAVRLVVGYAHLSPGRIREGVRLMAEAV
ncbi:PLP-dependent aminotransferase family protein [Streptomyces glaucescens]|uniref:MocR-like pyridoxine biosynthesis transcription factor PdxR n=1 Tax=Streptomyces glaucescens TaxID=1907 RepID=UPI000A389ADF|nr:PLP-dependent aminotransferase family protein [Streptomyces glaucescens]